MNSPKQGSTIAVSGAQHTSLVKDATRMISESANPLNLLSLLATSAEKDRQRKLKSTVIEQSARVLELNLEKTKELLALRTAIAEQSYIDQLRIQHRNTVGEMARQAESDLRESIVGLFCSKASLLETLAKLDADDDLKLIGAEVIARMTTASAEQLIHHNTKPR